MLKIENKYIKSKKSNSENTILIDEIREAEKEKAKIFMDIGILLYKKIREQSISDSSFEEMSESIVRLDKLIYENNMKLEDTRDEKYEIECECGSVIDEDSRFCSQCGKMIEQEIVQEKVECLCCGMEIDIDSKYCVCCGSRLNNQIYVDEI